MKTTTTLPRMIEKTQRLHNQFIRLRDRNEGCISCGSFNELQAGHYFSAGHYSALRFDEMNTNHQCKRCNYFLSGNQVEYRKGLIRKYGEERVLLLERSADLRKVRRWSRFELEVLQEYYKTQIKLLSTG